jgi:hypothetical protein
MIPPAAELASYSGPAPLLLGVDGYNVTGPKPPQNSLGQLWRRTASLRSRGPGYSAEPMEGGPSQTITLGGLRYRINIVQPHRTPPGLMQ